MLNSYNAWDSPLKEDLPGPTCPVIISDRPLIISDRFPESPTTLQTLNVRRLVEALRSTS